MEKEGQGETVMKERSGKAEAACSHLDWATKASKASTCAALAFGATSPFSSSPSTTPPSGSISPMSGAPARMLAKFQRPHCAALSTSSLMLDHEAVSLLPSLRVGEHKYVQALHDWDLLLKDW